MYRHAYCLVGRCSSNRMICLYTHVHLCAEKIAICIYHTPFMCYILQDTDSILDFKPFPLT